jgi:hypothetical protein
MLGWKADLGDPARRRSQIRPRLASEPGHKLLVLRPDVSAHLTLRDLTSAVVLPVTPVVVLEAVVEMDT